MPLRSYIHFFGANKRFLSFGVLVALGSSFGQTFFIGIVGPHLQTEFSLSHTAWGSIYLAGTLASALLLPWTGKLIDRIDLKTYSLCVAASLALACLFFSVVAGPLMLVVGIFLLRQTGQGLSSHVAMTSMARYFDAQRGRAIAVATSGFAIGEAVLPLMAVVVIGVIGWRWMYAGVGLALLVLAFPLINWALRGQHQRDRLQSASSGNITNVDEIRMSWSRRDVLRDHRFYMLLPGVLCPSIIGTALFFHHLNLADAKGWSHEWMTGSYIVYAIASIGSALASGPLIDRFSACRLVPLMVIPLVLCLLVVARLDDPWILWLYLVLFGLSSGLHLTAVTAMWAELYGVTYLGAIKSMATAMGVFGSAIGPVIMGALMDVGLEITDVCMLFAVYAAATLVLMYAALRGVRR